MDNIEIVKVSMSIESYKQIPIAIRRDLKVNAVDVEGFDYSEDEIWKDLKKQSDKAYKQLKAREYEIRHNINRSA